MIYDGDTRGYHSSFDFWRSCCLKVLAGLPEGAEEDQVLTETDSKALGELA